MRLQPDQEKWCVEVVRLYSNPEAKFETLQSSLARATSTRRPDERPVPRQTQIRLSPHDVAALAAAYRDGKTIKELAQRFGIHRVTVTAHLRRHGVELQRTGLTEEEIAAAAHLYGLGESLAQLGAKFGVDPTTAWRALRAAGVNMRPPNRRFTQFDV
jgi:transposase